MLRAASARSCHSASGRPGPPSFREARRQIFKSRFIGTQKKAACVQGLVMSRLLVGAGTWTPLLEDESKMFQSCVFVLYRQVLCLPGDSCQKLYSCNLCAATGFPSPSILLYVKRLRCAMQMVLHGPDPFWALVKQDKRYSSTMLDSFD